MDILIVGAGIGGLTAAVRLAQRGHRVRVLEQAKTLGEVGAGIQMSANAVKVLTAIGVEPALKASGVLPKAFEFRRFDSGELLHRIPLGDAHREKHGAAYYQMHRRDLHAALVEALLQHSADAIQLGAAVCGVHENDQEAGVELASGQTLRAELVIGADGVKSRVRQHVLGPDRPVFTGQVVWRVLVPVDRVPKELRTDIVSTIWCGPHNHGVMYYLRGGQLINFVGCVARPWEEESWTAARPWAELDSDYAGWHPMVRAVVEAADRDQCFRWALNSRVPAMAWSTPRVTMLGDAVHSRCPTWPRALRWPSKMPACWPARWSLIFRWRSACASTSNTVRRAPDAWWRSPPRWAISTRSTTPTKCVRPSTTATSPGRATSGCIPTTP